ncbi:MAG: lamin tail domain-containing protein, partial [candidate division Zixibacteria bacterium]|nr:lamin tail domain-containing protein [candidate division Zixibacteria bacterium]
MYQVRNILIAAAIFMLVLSGSVMADIVINEIHYNPGSAQGNDSDFEFLEIYNSGESAVDISGYYFDAGDSTGSQPIIFTFPASTTINADDYMVVAVDRDTFIVWYGFGADTVKVFDFSGALGNSGELCQLRDSAHNLIDELSYDDGGDWPTEPDGSGSSLELINPEFDNSLGTNWAGSVD